MEHADFELSYDDLPPSTREALKSLPPEQAVIAGLFARMERRMLEQQIQLQHHSDSIPPPAKKFKEWIEWGRWLVLLLAGIAGVGWFAAKYADGFQTKEEAAAVQAQHTEAHRTMQLAIDDNTIKLSSMQVSDVVFALEQQNAADRLEILVDTNRAATPNQRRAAEERAHELERRIAQRDRYLRDPNALRRLAERGDPLVGINGP